MYTNLPKPFLALAPMDDVTDTVFRQVVAACAAPDLTFTEFVNVDGLMSPGRPKLFKKLRFAPAETNLVAQLWGLNPANFQVVADQIASGSLAKELGLPEGCNFVGVDLNMGCPAKSEVQNGACSALIKLENRDLAGDIIEATRQGLAGRLPLSVKTRLGFSEVDLTWAEFLLGKELAMLTMHGRTRKEMSKVAAHWDLIGEVAQRRDRLAPDTLVVGNGDVTSWQQARDLARTYSLDGIMIGRGVFQNPFIFTRDGAARWQHLGETERLALFRRHVELFAATWQADERPIHTLNKFCKIYVSDFDGAKELREQLMACQSTDELLKLL